MLRQVSRRFSQVGMWLLTLTRGRVHHHCPESEQGL